MSDLNSIGNVVETWGKKALTMFNEAKGNPPLLGIMLIGAGSAIKMIPQIDIVIFDLSGKHVPPANVQNVLTTSAKTGAPIPQWAKDILSVTNDIGSVLSQSFSADLQMGFPSAASLSALSGPALPLIEKALPNVLGILGITLPTQITISEILIFGGILLLAEPLLSSLSGSLNSLLKAAPAAVALG